MDLYIDKEQSTPIYRQITMQITKMVQDGILNPGDKLPAERALADSLGIARGTIKKAYMELASNKVIEITQGRGSFVSSEHEIQSEGRKEQAVAHRRGPGPADETAIRRSGDTEPHADHHDGAKEQTAQSLHRYGGLQP